MKGTTLFLMAMEVHNAPGRDMDCFIKECVRVFHNRQSGGHLSLSFCIQFFRQCVSITLQRVLTSTIKRKIVLANDACSRPPTTIRSHDLDVGGNRGVVVEITSYHKKD
jgi:hypothetical protein